MTPAVEGRKDALRLIFNADDFGASPGVNLAVARAYREGILDSASLFMNAPHTGEAILLAADLPELRIGVHLNLTAQDDHRALADPARAALLTDARGRLKHGFAGLLRLSLLRPAELRRQAEIEMRAQIEKALAAGLRPAHLDSHRHVHMIPVLFETARRLRDEFGIPRLRDVNESLSLTWRGGGGIVKPLLNGGLAKYLVLKTFSRLNHGGGDVYFYSILHTTRLFGRNVRRILVPPGMKEVEICLHPSLLEADRKNWRAGYRDLLLHSPDKSREFETLLDKGLPGRIGQAAGLTHLNFRSKGA